MADEEETREVLFPQWMGADKHGLTIEQKAQGEIFIKEVKDESPAAHTGRVFQGKELTSCKHDPNTNVKSFSLSPSIIMHKTFTFPKTVCICKLIYQVHLCRWSNCGCHHLLWKHELRRNSRLTEDAEPTQSWTETTTQDRRQVALSLPHGHTVMGRTRRIWRF